jgi:hypothetical protein
MFFIWAWPLRVGQGFARNLRKTLVIVYARLCCKSSHDVLKFYIDDLHVPTQEGGFPLPSLTQPYNTVIVYRSPESANLFLESLALVNPKAA